MWPGRTESAVAGSGAPKSMLGRKSVKVLDMARDTMNVSIRGVGIHVKRNVIESIITKTVFGWRPGMSPVATPVPIPSKIKNNISRNINR